MLIKAYAYHFNCNLCIVGFLVCDYVLFIRTLSVWGSWFYYLILSLACVGQSIIVLSIKNFPSVQVASLRMQKTVEAREEESEEIKHIKKVINLLTCTRNVL